MAKNQYFHVFVFFILTRLVAIFFGLPSVSDVEVYLYYFSRIDSGLSPYSQFAFEYPPLSLVPIYLIGKFHSENFIQYAASFALLLFIFDFICLETCRYYCRKRLKMSENKVAYMTFIYSLFGLLLFKLLYQRLDLIVAFFFANSLVLFSATNSRLKFSFSLNAFLGFFYKIVPAITMPAAIILKDRAISKIIKNSLIFLAGLLGTIWILQIFTDHTFVENMSFHSDRGIQIESTFGSFLLIKNILIGKISIIYQQYGSYDIKTSQALTDFSKFFGHFTLLFFYAAIFLKFRHQKEISEKNFLDVTLISILLFLTFQRILSPQFFIWLIPILSIWLTQNRSLKILSAFLFIFICTWAIFSIDYLALTNQEPILVTILCVRNFVLIGLTIFLVRKFLKDERKS